jgi:hypothetical protein
LVASSAWLLTMTILLVCACVLKAVCNNVCIVCLGLESKSKSNAQYSTVEWSDCEQTSSRKNTPTRLPCNGKQPRRNNVHQRDTDESRRARRTHHSREIATLYIDTQYSTTTQTPSPSPSSLARLYPNPSQPARRAIAASRPACTTRLPRRAEKSPVQRVPWW